MYERYKYITIGQVELSKELFQEPKNRSFCKPQGGLWACEYTPDKEFISSWQEWCYDESFHHGKEDIGVLFNVSEKARIYTIDRLIDLKKLMLRYRDKNALAFMPSLDFEEISKHYDIIHLTDKGQWETRLSHPISLYGWDVESSLILNYDVIMEQITIPIVEKIHKDSQ